MLIIAVAHLPYGYYTLTRVVTCGIGVIIAYTGFRGSPTVQLWSVPIALIAALFNPVVPIYLHRQTWFYIDLGAAAIFVLHFVFVRWKASNTRATP
jgi:hypothetical protein